MFNRIHSREKKKMHKHQSSARSNFSNINNKLKYCFRRFFGYISEHYMKFIISREKYKFIYEMANIAYRYISIYKHLTDKTNNNKQLNYIMCSIWIKMSKDLALILNRSTQKRWTRKSQLWFWITHPTFWLIEKRPLTSYIYVA